MDYHLTNIAQAFVLIMTNPLNIGMLIFSSFIGLLAGATPGITSVAITAILLPFTLWLPPDTAIISLIAAYASAVYGGSVSAVLFRIPGSTENIMTALDGYELTKRGKSGFALMLSRFYSFIGGFVGGIIVLFFTPVLADVAIMFGPSEMFALIVMAISFLATFEGGFKAVVSALLGFFLATIGSDPTTGMYRFTFGITALGGGFDLVAVLLGIFAVPEILRLLESKLKIDVIREKYTFKELMFPSKSFFIKSAPLIFLVAIPIGWLIGFLPGIGASTAAVIAYIMAKRFSKEPEKWGTGIPEGVAVPEAANNAAAMGTLVPTLALGIPGGAATAIILGALMIHGVIPGAWIFKYRAQLGYTVLVGTLLSNLIFYVLAPVVIYMFLRIGEFLRKNIPFLAISVIFFSVFGAYAIRNSVVDIMAVLFIGVISYLLGRYKFPTAPMAIGFVLGPLAEKYFRRALDIAFGNPAVFITSPISQLIYVATLIMIVVPTFYSRKKKAEIRSK
ncbi:MAG: tripartite tricarboxylate transporter permease [Sulfolobales archaeon]|nr:tripartite tricarboxylate transporter permease [Sulfolobales archaeon]